jgi:quinol monooxygenase YgiN
MNTQRLLLATLVSLTLLGYGAHAVFATTGEPPMVLRHVVLFKFKPEATAEQIRSVETAFAQLPSLIPEMKSFEWGTDVSPEGLAKGHTHCFISTFHSAADRDAYLTHPEHKKFGQLVGPLLADVTVVDFWTKP